MSAYGAIKVAAPTEPLLVRSYSLHNGLSITTHPVHGADCPPAVIDYFFKVFNAELASGKSYPQEGPLTRDEFVAYFFNSTTIVGILHDHEKQIEPSEHLSIEEARTGKTWEDALAGVYYIKPNYPGRSSHNCNAGFLVPPVQRGKKIGNGLAESYLHYAPRLGYRASVFNLVYKNNVASIRLWDKLGFERVGVVPEAGRLKTGPNGEDEYHDAYVIYKKF